MDLKVAIIGAGVIGKRISWFFYKDNNLPIKWVCDTDLEKAKYLAGQCGADFTDTIDNILSDDEINIVYIGVPPKYHKDIAISALQAGKHVLCEKPLSLNAKEALEMVNEENISSKITAVNLPFRFNPAVLRIKELLSQDVLGQIARLELKFRFPSWPREWQPNAWLSKREQGGAIREVGTHFIFLLNELEPWFGKVKKIWSKINFGEGDSAEWSAIGLLSFSSGLLCSLNLLTGSPEPEENTLLIIGSKKVVSFEMWNKLYEIQPDGSKINITLDFSETYPLVDTFIKEIKGVPSEIPSVTFADAAKTQELIDLLLTSKEEWIEVT